MGWLTFTGKELSKLTTNDLADFLIWLGEKGYSQNSIKRHYYAIKKFIKYLGLDIDWSTLKVRTKEKYDFKILNEDEVRYLINIAWEIKPVYGLMLWLGYEAALRVSELCNAKVRDLDLVRCAFLKKPVKSEKPIEVPLSDELCAKLKDYVQKNGLKLDDYLFTTKFNKPWNRSTFHKYVFNVVIARAGFIDEYGKPKVRYHDFARHSRATNLLRRGIDIYTVNKILGHKLLQTTLIYLHLVRAEELRERMRMGGVK